jgi:hypothetical protein
MGTITFDTHKFIQTLKASGVPEKQAEAITEAVRDAQSATGVATQGDIALLRKDMEMLRHDFDSEMKLMKWMTGTTMALCVAILVRLLLG